LLKEKEWLNDFISFFLPLRQRGKMRTQRKIRGNPLCDLSFLGASVVKISEANQNSLNLTLWFFLNHARENWRISG
jgi:hypothetical protein